jgi:VWFA-related protein
MLRKTSVILFLMFLTSHVYAQVNCPPQEQKELRFTVIDKSGEPVKGLRPDDLALKIGDRPATIATVSSRTDEPYDLAVLVDISISQEEVLPLIKLAARTFVNAVADGGVNRIALVSFSHEKKYEQPLTTDTGKLLSAIDRLRIDVPPGYVGGGVVVVSGSAPKTQSLVGSTALWDATRKAIAETFAATDQNRRRAVLLFTDGEDTSSKGKLKTVIEESLKQGVSVYVVGTTSSYTEVAPDPLKKFSEETGGVAVFPKKTKDYDTALTQIFRRLSTQYVIGYCGEDAPRAKVEIKLVNPEIKKLSPVFAYRRS